MIAILPSLAILHSLAITQDILLLLNRLGLQLMIKDLVRKTVPAGKLKYIFGTFIFLSFFSKNDLHAQNFHAIKKYYSYQTIGQSGRVLNFKFYYIIANETIGYKGETYNSFVISEDSTDVCGYIRFDSTTKQMYFLSKHFKETDVTCPEASRVQVLFCFFNNSVEVCNAGDLGAAKFISNTEIDSQNKPQIKITLLPDFHPSDMNYIDALIFAGSLYPKSILYHDERLMKDVLLNANDF